MMKSITDIFRAGRTVLMTALAAFVLASCPNPLDEGFVDKVKKDVAEAVAPERKLTVTGDGNGIVSPTGRVTVKDGISFPIDATAFSSHVFKRWTQTAGSGAATFSDPASASSAVTIVGGNATIRAEFDARPVVYYSIPTGTGIYTNTAIYVYFSKDMDEDSIEASGAVSVLKGGSAPIEGTISLSSARIAKFVPSEYLSPQQYYVIRIAKTVSDTEGIEMDAEYSSTFKTASTSDIVAPVDPAFSVNGTNPTHVDTRSITLTGVSAVDEGDIVEVRISENGGEPISVPYAETIEYMLSTSGDGDKTLRIWAVDSVLNHNPAEYAERTVRLDTAAPTGTFDIRDAGNAAVEYVNSRSVILASSIADAGTAMAGALMRYSLNGGTTWSDWEAYESAKAETLPDGQGAKSVSFEVKDFLGHTLTLSDGITYDSVDPTFGTFTVAAGAAYSVSRNVELALAASDETGSGVHEMSFSQDGGISWSAWKSYASTDTFLFNADGDRTLGARVRDRAGNIATNSDGIFVDTVAPTISAFTIDGGATYALAAGVSAAQTAVDEGGAAASGLSRMRFSNDGTTWSAWENFLASKAWTLAAGDGSKTVRIQVRDSAGNVSPISTDGIILDTAAPVVSSFAVLGTGDGTNYATNSTGVTLSYSVTDAAGTPIEMRFNAGAGWSSWTAYAAGATVTLPDGDGTKTVIYEFRDVADTTNHLATGSDGIILDATAPSASTGITTPANAFNSSYTSGTQTVTGTAADTYSVWKVEFYIGGSLVSTDTTAAYTYSWNTAGYTNGTAYGVRIRSYDRAGNYTDSANVNRTVDNAVPSISSFLILGTGDGTHYSINTTAAALSSSVSDAHSALQMRFSNDNSNWSAWEAYSASKAFTLTAVDGTRYVYAQFRDAAGNQSETYDGIVLDRVAPSSAAFSINYAGTDPAYVNTTRTISSTPADNYAVWKVEFLIGGSIRATDTTSPFTYSWVTTDTVNYTEGSTYSVACRAYDRAGNYTTAASVNRTIDNTPPAVATMTAPASTTDRTPTWTWSWGSGGLSANIRLYNGSTGTYVTDWTSTTATSYTHGTELPDGVYYLYMYEYDRAGNNAFSSSYFTLDGAPKAPTISTAALISGSIIVDATPTFSWAGNGFGTGSFRYRLWDKTAGAYIFDWTAAAAVVTFTSSALTTDHEYYFQVAEIDSDGDYSPSASLTIFLKEVFPLSGATGVLRRPTLYWRPLTRQKNTYYTLQYKSGSIWYSWAASLSDSEYTIPTALNATTTYTWRVMYTNTLGSTSYWPTSAGATFTTGTK